MKILVACEESQAVTIEFRKLGHEAYSCDIEPCSGGHPEWHIQGDVTPLLEEKWDMIIAFPPCTHLAVSGARWFEEKRKDGRQQAAIEFFMKIANADCERIAIENPIGIMSSEYRKPDQIIQPYEYGHEARKSTCLWLKGLPKLEPTNLVNAGKIVGKGFSVGANLDYARDENGKAIPWNDPRTAAIRSKTFQGIAKALSEQYGGDIRDEQINGIDTWK